MRTGWWVLAGALLVAGCGSGGGTGSDTPAPVDAAPKTITVTSSVFADNQPIPRDYTCKGGGAAPALSWTGVPADAASIALVVFDPDAGSDGFTHWVLYDLPPKDGSLAGDQPPAGATEGDNSAGRPGWTPPCPPSGTHHYLFTVYALPAHPSGQSTADVVARINATAIARGVLTGLVSSS
ncbi:MAG TPA: YbhB/YbcL family Raf kinase inhibitor-like protein [Mycobacteriales bacterium]|nr:YbhB/YbcL family Raf kinase inhibitor-like protein [Mycobacteriales bacterium]